MAADEVTTAEDATCISGPVDGQTYAVKPGTTLIVAFHTADLPPDWDPGLLTIDQVSTLKPNVRRAVYRRYGPLPLFWFSHVEDE